MALVEDLEYELLRDESLVDLLDRLCGHNSLGFCLGFLLFWIRWRRSSVFDEELLHLLFVVSYCKIDRSLAALVHDRKVAAQLQNVLHQLYLVRLDRVIEGSLPILIYHVMVRPKRFEKLGC